MVNPFVTCNSCKLLIPHVCSFLIFCVLCLNITLSFIPPCLTLFLSLSLRIAQPLFRSIFLPPFNALSSWKLFIRLRMKFPPLWQPYPLSQTQNNKIKEETQSTTQNEFSLSRIHVQYCGHNLPPSNVCSFEYTRALFIEQDSSLPSREFAVWIQMFRTTKRVNGGQGQQV
jgi:hypothetical protein